MGDKKIDKESKNKSSAILSYEKLKFPLTLRTWENGDWFMPSGMNGKKKLSDYFIDNNVYKLYSNRIIIIIPQHHSLLEKLTTCI